MNAAPTPTSTPPARLRGVALMVGGTALFACADVIAKQLTQTLDPISIAWLRYIVFALLVVPFAMRGGRMRSKRPGLQILRGLGMLGSALIFMTGLVFLPVADATAIFFIVPILITGFAVIFLKETVGWRRWLAAFAGFLGVLIIIRPGTGAFQIASLLPVLAAFAWASAATITRYMSGSDGPLTTLAYSALVGFAALSLLAPFVFVLPTRSDLAWAILMGLLSTGGHGLVVLAFREASASLLAPYTYGQIIWAGALGLVVFGTFPDGPTILGALIIAGSGIYTSYRERVSAAGRQ